MVLSESEEILIIIAGAAFIMALIGNAIKDYRRMSWEAKKKVLQKERDEAYVRQLKKIIDQKNETLRAQIKKQKES